MGMLLDSPQFDAAWSTTLKLLTGGTLGLLLAIMLLSVFRGSSLFSLDRFLGIALPLAIIAGTAAFSVRGYSIEDGQIRIHRLGWSTTYPVDTVQDAEVVPGIMKGSIRTWGNGGLFGFVGHFQNDRLGAYRAYATNATDIVHLRIDGESIVITPNRPGEFVGRLKQHAAWEPSVVPP